MSHISVVLLSNKSLFTYTYFSDKFCVKRDLVSKTVSKTTIKKTAEFTFKRISRGG